jgi:hypothetical protein
MSLSSSNQSSQSQLDPQFKEAFLNNLQSTQNVAANLKPREFAGFNADQNQAFDLNRLYASPLSAPTLYATDAANLIQQASNYNPQTVTYNAYGGATVNPADLAAQKGYKAATGTYASAGTATPASYKGFNYVGAGGANEAIGSGYTADAYGGQTAGAAERFAGISAGDAERAKAAQLARSSIREVGTSGVTGAGVTSEALGAIAPQARANIRDVNAASFLNQNIQQYMNPYTQAVTEQSLTDLERSRQLEQQRTAAQATASKAYGGSRQGVAEAETNRAYGENAARLVAQQNAAAYAAAQQASEADLARQMQSQQLNQAQDAATTQQSLQLAGQFGLANQDANLRAALANQGVDLSTGQLNTQNAQQTALANQAAANQMAQYNAGNLQQAGLASQSQANQMAQFNAANLQQAGLASMAASNQAAQFGAGASNQAALQNAAAQNAMAQYNASNQQQANQFGAGAANTAFLQNANAANQMAQFNAGNQQAMNLANLGYQNQANQFGASAFNQAGLANAAAKNAVSAQQANLFQQAGLTNANNFLQANLANQQAGLTANQQSLSGGTQLANAATNLQNLGFNQANQLRDQGLLQQGFSQQTLDAVRNLPLEQQQLINQALGLNVGGGSGATSSSSGSSFGASLFGK